MTTNLETEQQKPNKHTPVLYKTIEIYIRNTINIFKLLKTAEHLT